MGNFLAITGTLTADFVQVDVGAGMIDSPMVAGNKILYPKPTDMPIYRSKDNLCIVAEIGSNSIFKLIPTPLFMAHLAIDPENTTGYTPVDTVNGIPVTTVDGLMTALWAILVPFTP